MQDELCNLTDSQWLGLSQELQQQQISSVSALCGVHTYVHVSSSLIGVQSNGSGSECLSSAGLAASIRAE